MFVKYVIVLSLYFFYVHATCPTIISRSEWGARSPKRTTALRNTPVYVVVHHTDTPDCTSSSACKTRIQSIQNQHMNTKGWTDIGYSFLIGGDGNVYEGRGWNVHGAHAPNYNYRSIGISLIGNFQDSNPSNAQTTALTNLIECGQELGKISSNYNLVGHRQVKATDCPGTNLYNIIKSWPHFKERPT